MFAGAKTLKGIYFTLVGVTPLAVANSFSWFSKIRADVTIEKVYFIISESEKAKTETEKEMLPKVISAIGENFQHFGLDFEKVTFEREKLIVIPQADLQKSCEKLVTEVQKRSSASELVFIDVTAGRKTMTGAGTIAAIFSQNHFNKLKKAVSVHLVYYWLKLFTQEHMKKMAYQLGRDDIEIKICDVKDLIETLGEIPFD